MKRSLISLWHRFADDDSGAISILAVGAIVAAIGVSVIVVDAGSLLYAKRQLQAAADAAAMSAVRDIGKAGGDPTARAEEALAANGFDDPKSLQVLSGGYDADESIAPASRFDTAAGTSNAVKVMTSIDSPTYFAQFFGVPGTSEVYAESTAAMVDQASISAGTGLASLNDGIANNLLTALLGTAVNLSAANYQGLVDTKIDALAFLDALATRVGVSGTYGDLLSANASVGDIVNAALDVLASGDTSHSSGDPVAAQQALNALPESALNALDLSISAVIDASELQDRQIGNIVRTGTNDLKVNAYDLLIAAVMGQANGETIDLGTTLSLPVTGTSISTRIAIGQPEAQSKIGPVGTQVKTAQIILALEITAVDTQPTGLGTSSPLGLLINPLSLIGSLATVNVSLPIYVDLAEGTATIDAIPCNRSGTMVRLNGVPNTALVGIGRFSDTALANSVSTTDAPTPDETAPPLATISTSVLGPVAEVTASSTPVSTGAGSGLRDFTQIDIDNGTKKRVVAGLHTSNLVSTLLAQTSLSTSILPGLPLISLVTNSILTPLVDTVVAGTLTPLLSQIFSALDPAINQLLAALGIQVGTLDMGVNGVSCGVPKLVG